MLTQDKTDDSYALPPGGKLARAVRNRRKPDDAERWVLQLLSDQNAIPIYQLAGMLGVYRSDMERYVRDFLQAGWVESRRFITGDDVWVWLTRRGSKLSGTGFQSKPVNYWNLAHWRAINEVRMEVEASGEVLRWISERQLRREKGGSVRGYLPDAVVEIGGQRHAIEVELSEKPAADLREKILVNEQSYHAVVYFASESVCGLFDRLGLKDKEAHPGLRVHKIAADERSLSNPEWRIEGDPSPRSRRFPKIEDLKLSKGEVDALDVLADQGLVPMDQLRRLLDLDAEECELLVSSFVRNGLVQRAKPLVDEPNWVWLTTRGTKLSTRDLGVPSPRLGGLEFARAINEVRIQVTKGEAGSLVEWISGRKLHKMREHAGAAPHGAIKIGPEMHAVEVFLTPPEKTVLVNRLGQRLAEFDAVAWFYSRRAGTQLKNLAKEFKSELLEIRPLPNVNLPAAPGSLKRQPKRVREQVGNMSPLAWPHLVGREPVVMYSASVGELPDGARQAIKVAARTGQKPRVLKVWIRRQGSWFYCAETDIGVYGVLHWSEKWYAIEIDDLSCIAKVSSPHGPELANDSVYQDEDERREAELPLHGEVSDELWKELVAVFPGGPPRGCSETWISDRAVLCAGLYGLRNEIVWERFPRELGYGSGGAIRTRMRGWAQSPGWDRFLEVLKQNLPDARRLNWSRFEATRHHPLPSRRGAKAVRELAEQQDELVIGDALWAELKPRLPRRKVDRAGVRPISDRLVLSAILFVLRTGINWKELVPELGLGSSTAVRKRILMWEQAGELEGVVELLREKVPDGDQLEWARVPSQGSKSRATVEEVRRRKEADGPVYEMDDELWAELEPLFPRGKESGKRDGRRVLSDRALLSGAIFLVRFDIPWQHLPRDLGYGSPTTVREYILKWQKLEGWEAFVDALEEKLPDGRKHDWSRLRVKG
jgi:transposase/DNA-binding MarR family transcriptional regulator